MSRPRDGKQPYGAPRRALLGGGELRLEAGPAAFNVSGGFIQVLEDVRVTEKATQLVAREAQLKKVADAPPFLKRRAKMPRDGSLAKCVGPDTFRHGSAARRSHGWQPSIR